MAAKVYALVTLVLVWTGHNSAAAQSLGGALGEFTAKTGIQVSAEAAQAIEAILAGKLDAASVALALDKFPVLHIHVQPEPPMDYIIVVNGRVHQPAKPNAVVVPPGKKASVQVSRGSHKPCLWNGVVKKDEVIRCDFPASP